MLTTHDFLLSIDDGMQYDCNMICEWAEGYEIIVCYWKIELQIFLLRVMF